MLPAMGKVRKVEHHAALDWRKAPGFMRELRQRDSFGARALEFAILTAARSGEIRGARWGEINLEQAIWTIPADRMKGGRMHRVPLSEPALAMLREMAEVKDGSGLVFLGMKRGVPMSDVTLGAVLAGSGALILPCTASGRHSGIGPERRRIMPERSLNSPWLIRSPARPRGRTGVVICSRSASD
jgi:integrase